MGVVTGQKVVRPKPDRANFFFGRGFDLDFSLAYRTSPLNSIGRPRIQQWVIGRAESMLVGGAEAAVLKDGYGFSSLFPWWSSPVLLL